MPKKHILRLLILVHVISAALPALADTPRIMLLGDSWAWFVFLNKSIDQALDARGLGQWSSIGMHTAIPGSTSHQWTQQEWLDNVTAVMEKNPTVDIVHLSLGGNDYLRRWNKEMSPEARDALFNGVVSDIKVVIDHILSVRPDMKIAVVSYDYVNENRRNSTLQDLNRAGQILEKMKQDLTRKYENVEHIHNYGLMQYHFGHEPDFPPHSVPFPGQAPDFDPFPGGNPDFGNPPASMSDDIHLSTAGYKVLGEHCVDVLYAKWLEEDPAPGAALAAAPENEARTE